MNKCKTCNQEIPKQNATMVIKELKIEIETSIHNKGETLEVAMKSCPKGWRIPTYAELQWLRNSKYRDKLGLDDTWEFIKQEDDICKDEGYVARFIAYSGWADLYCGRYPRGSVSGLGVRFVKEMNK